MTWVMRESSARASRSMSLEQPHLGVVAQRLERVDRRIQAAAALRAPGLQRAGAAGTRDGARRVRRLEQRRQHDLVRIRETGLLAGERAHADAVVDAVRAVLDDAVLERPRLLADQLEVGVGVVDRVTHDVAEHVRDAVLVEAGGQQQAGARGGERVGRRVRGRRRGLRREQGGRDLDLHGLRWCRRRCWTEGKFCLTSRCRTRSMSATTTPLPRGKRASTLPQQSTIIESPWVSRPFSWKPDCAGATTWHRFSIARARSSVSQCARPVGAVNADGRQNHSAPWSSRRRNSSGKAQVVADREAEAAGRRVHADGRLPGAHRRRLLVALVPARDRDVEQVDLVVARDSSPVGVEHQAGGGDPRLVGDPQRNRAGDDPQPELPREAGQRVLDRPAALVLRDRQACRPPRAP